MTDEELDSNDKDELEKVMRFEQKLAKISARKEDRRNDTKLYNPTTLGELSESWTTYVSDLFHFDVFFKSLITITASEKVIIRDPKFYEQLSSVLQSTSIRTIANYMSWRMIKASIKYLGRGARDIRQKFLQVLTGVSIEKVPWKRCTKKVGFNNQYDRETFNYAVGSMYARHVFDIEAKRQVDDMTGYIRKAFNEILHIFPSVTFDVHFNGVSISEFRCCVCFVFSDMLVFFSVVNNIFLSGHAHN